MIKTFLKSLNIWKPTIEDWARNHVLGLFIFNLILMLLILLHSAGYFAPYLEITINLIFFICLLALILLLKATSKVIFIIAIAFWIFAGVLRIIGIDIWAERTAIYTFEGFLVGVFLQIIEDK